MASHVPPVGTLFSQTKLVFDVACQLGFALFDALPPIPENQHGPFRRRFANGFVRHVLSLSLDQRRALAKPTGAAIISHCNSVKKSVKSVPLTTSPSSTLHFVDCDERSSGRLLLYVHGGGYVDPISERGHVPFAIECAKSANASLAFLEYSLAPEHHYPIQLDQAAEAIRYLLGFRKADSIIIGGDSAGGNLVLSLMSHIKSPNPNVRKLDLGGQAFAGTFLLSPWIGLDYTFDSYRTNVQRDYLSPEKMHSVTNMWKPVKSEVWCNFILNSCDWTDAPTGELLVTAGSWEIFLDDIKKFVENFTSVANNRQKTHFVICPKELHASCVVDVAFGYKDGVMLTETLKWFEKI